MRKILLIVLIFLFSSEVYSGGHKPTTYGPRPKLKLHGLVNAQCSKLGVCHFSYESEEVRKIATELGLSSGKIRIRILNFEPNYLRKINSRCNQNGEWVNFLWQSTVNHLEEAERVTVVGRKYKQGMFGHVYFGQRDSVTSIIDLLNRKTKQDCKL